MKRTTIPQAEHISSLVRRVTHIVICEDARDELTSTSISASLFASEEFDNDYDQEEVDKYYLGVDDDLILEESPEVIHKFENVALLKKVAKLNPDLLSAVQQKLLQDVFNKKFTLTRKDVEKILDMIHGCNSISYSYKHKQTNRFLRDSEGVLRIDDCLDILHQLDISDYVSSRYSMDWDYIGDALIVFEPIADWVADDGTTFHDLVIYVKLDVDLTTKDAIALVSMHEAKYGRDDRPYAENGNEEN